MERLEKLGGKKKNGGKGGKIWQIESTHKVMCISRELAFYAAFKKKPSSKAAIW